MELVVFFVLTGACLFTCVDVMCHIFIGRRQTTSLGLK